MSSFSQLFHLEQKQNGNTHAHLVNAHHKDDSMAKPPYIYPSDQKNRGRQDDLLQDLEWDCLIWFRGRQLPPSLPRYPNDSKGPRVAAGISDPRAEISGIIVMVRRSGNTSRGTATGFFFFGSLFAIFSLACFSFPTEATLRYLDSLLFISITRG